MHQATRILITLCILSILMVFFTGCGQKQADEPTKTADQSELARMSGQQGQASTKQEANPSNSAYAAASGLTLTDETSKDIDSLIAPVLKEVFGGAKIIAESHEPETRDDGEVIENKITYVVPSIFRAEDGRRLHSAFLAAHFGTSPRLGSEPTIIKATKQAMMSFLETTPQRPYSFVITLDAAKQQITVVSYKLGSKYDRLM